MPDTTARRRPDPSTVAPPGRCCRGWCYLDERIENEIHDLARNPARYGMPEIVVARCQRGREWDDRWFWACHVPDCDFDSFGEVDGADAWAETLRDGLAHLHEQHGAAA